nr:TolC family protein [uncultured Mucilaginibacter sp.]
MTNKLLSYAAGCLFVLLAPGSVLGQAANTLSLEQCYRQAELNYPLTKQRGLIEQTKAYNIDNIAKGVFPQFSVNGQATYQSEVTSIAVPGFNVPTVSKTQYNLHGEVSQTLTDFAINKQKRTISGTEADIQQANLDAELFQLKGRINQLFFGIILIEGQLEQSEISKTDIRTGIAKVQAAVDNGTGFMSSVNKLKAELLTADQHTIELKASRKAYADMLAAFINQPIDTNTVFTKPAEPVLTDSINRPELKAYNLQMRSYAEQQRLTKVSNYPQLSAFFQGGIGNPSPVNFLASGLSSYYITGVRLSWNMAGLYTYHKSKLISKNNQDMVADRKNTFLFNTNLTLRQQNADVDRYRELIRSDDEIIKLRSSVKQTSAVQLQNGVMTANDYLLDINAEARARQDRTLHQVQLLMAQYDRKTTSGN